MNQKYDWGAIQAYHDEGHSKKECREKFGFHIGTWSMAVKKGWIVDHRPVPKHDWEVIQAYYDTGKTRRECEAKFGFSANTWHKAKLRGDILPRKQGLPLEDRLVEGSSYASGKLRPRLIEQGLLANKCAECGIGPEYNGKPLTLQLDHINGTSNDNRLENLRILCPNCHTQTNTYGSKNLKNTERVRTPYTRTKG